MLTQLRIQNVVLIDRLDIDFRAGFCALTGETGAGKSILLDSLGLALGVRAESRLVRKGADQAQVSAVFETDKDHPACNILHDSNIEIEKGEPLILRRVLKADGGSRAFINDQPVSIALLKQAGETLVEIHGQFETQGLLDPATHRGMLDDYAGLDGDKIAGLWNGWRQAEEKLEEERAAIEAARAEEDYLRTSLEDLDALGPEQGEEDKLASLRERLMHREQVSEALSGAYAALTDESGAENALGIAARCLDRLGGRGGEEAAKIVETLDRAGAEIQEALALIQRLSADLEESDYSLEQVDERLHELRAQARKHGCAVDDLPEKRDELAARLNQIERQDDVLAALMKETDQARGNYIAAAKTAGAQRRKAASKLDALVAKELGPLKLEKARFVTQVEELPEERWGAHGMDSVRFLVATNPGSEPGPLNKIASGGEMARFMLALKVVMATVGAAGTLVFDEVDSGIGGATASAVGERLARLAKDKQILVVTHSPQVAGRALHHWIVLKDGGDAVKTTVVPLAEVHERREEIARMLSGAEVSSEARAAADKLLETGA